MYWHIKEKNRFIPNKNEPFDTIIIQKTKEEIRSTSWSSSHPIPKTNPNEAKESINNPLMNSPIEIPSSLPSSSPLPHHHSSESPSKPIFPQPPISESFQEKKSESIYNSIESPIIDGKTGFGIVYFLYGSDSASLTKYLNEILQSADTYRRVEPGVNITLFSTDVSLVKNSMKGMSHYGTWDSLFTSIIEIPKEMQYSGRQWITRIEALALTPYALTLAVDSDTYACTPISQDLIYAAKTIDFDYAFAGHHYQYNYSVYVDGGVMLMRWTQQTKQLLREWAILQKKRSLQHLHDDQVSLVLTFLNWKKLNLTAKPGRLNYNFGTRWYPAKNQNMTDLRYEHTLVIQNEVRSIHMRTMYGSSKIICDILNDPSYVNTPRVMFVDRQTHRGLWGTKPEQKLREGFRMAFSLKDCKMKMNGTECKDMDWYARDIITPLNHTLKQSDLLEGWKRGSDQD